MSETLHKLLESGSLTCKLVRDELVLSDGNVKTFDVRPTLRAAGCKFDGNSKAWRCPATDIIRGAVQRGRVLVQCRRDEQKASEERVAHVQSIRLESTSARVSQRATTHAGRMTLDPAFTRRDYEYGQRLLHMSATSTAPMGKDGAPNWPDPPNPMVA